VKTNSNDNDLNSIDLKSKAFFSGGAFRWNKSSADIWAILESKIADQPKIHVLTVNFSMVKWMAAASIVILFSIVSFIRLYTESVVVPAGQHAETTLPDQSKINLNAESSVSYHPYWWWVNRKVKLQGEAFFEVEKGRKFTVESSKGITQVLGTSFNIFSREDIYKVTCVTGRVRVKSSAGHEAVITSNSKAEICSKGEITVLTHIETFPEISWKKNIFIFTATPVYQVFHEIERQYGISIEAKVDGNFLYSGNFTKVQNVEEILAYVCPAMGLKFVRKSGGEYFISRNDE
jgi:ferric-dicitrate binding protein FerR (iron transport regulator)